MKRPSQLPPQHQQQQQQQLEPSKLVTLALSLFPSPALSKTFIVVQLVSYEFELPLSFSMIIYWSYLLDQCTHLHYLSWAKSQGRPLIKKKKSKKAKLEKGIA